MIPFLLLTPSDTRPIKKHLEYIQIVECVVAFVIRCQIYCQHSFKDFMVERNKEREDFKFQPNIIKEKNDTG